LRRCLGPLINTSVDGVPRFIVANPAWLCHKRTLIARLIKGCRVDARAAMAFTK